MRMNGIKLLLTILAACLAQTGCLTTQHYKDSDYAPTPVGGVEVVDLHQIQHKYEVIGMVECNTEFGNVKYLRKKAAEIGANAISIPDVRGDIMTSQAIRYKD